MDEAAFKRWMTKKESPENCKVEKSLHWTKSDGGRYQEMEDGLNWKEYDANNKEIRSLVCVWREYPKGTMYLREEGTSHRIELTCTRSAVDIKMIEGNVGFGSYESFEENGVWICSPSTSN